MFGYLLARYYLFRFKHIEEAICHASNDGHIHVLEWFNNNGYGLEYFTEEVILIACKNNNIELLEWLKCEFKFKDIRHCIFYSANIGNPEVLEWFKKKSGYKFKYNKTSFSHIFNNKVLNFLVKNINVKKVMKFKSIQFIKTIKFRTKNNYIKGYNKN